MGEEYNKENFNYKYLMNITHIGYTNKEKVSKSEENWVDS